MNMNMNMNAELLTYPIFGDWQAENNPNIIFLPYTAEHGIKVKLALTREEAEGLIRQLGGQNLKYPTCKFLLPEQQLARTKVKSTHIMSSDSFSINEQDENRKYSITLNLNPDFKFEKRIEDPLGTAIGGKVLSIAEHKKDINYALTKYQNAEKRIKELEGEPDTEENNYREIFEWLMKESCWEINCPTSILIPLNELNLNNFVEVCHKTAQLITNIHDNQLLSSNQTTQDIQRLNKVPSLYKLSLDAVDDGVNNSRISTQSVKELPREVQNDLTKNQNFSLAR